MVRDGRRSATICVYLDDNGERGVCIVIMNTFV